MFHLPAHYQNLSLRLSDVLEDIGVNETMVKHRRRLTILWETLLSISMRHPVQIFGSLSEGTTTHGLKSDIDVVFACPGHNVIQDYAEWKPGQINLLMIQDDITSPGYCHLQLIRPDMPLPVTDIVDECCVKDANGRILWKNNVLDFLLNVGFKNGAAWTHEKTGFNSTDFVIVFPCESWPIEAKDWSQRSLGHWPTQDMKRYAENSGCFVVPVGSKVGQIEELEWRISTSKAERCLMFNLNITQIQCYVLLKIILKTYLQHPVSSYMCKTVLLRCIEKTNYKKMWQPKNLFMCLTVCLHALYGSILHKSCPHYFIPKNNLMAGKFSPNMKEKLLKSLHNILGQEAALYGIKTDNLGERLAIKMNPLYHSLSANDISDDILCDLIRCTAWIISDTTAVLVTGGNHLGSPIVASQYYEQRIWNLLRHYKNGTKIERKALQLLVPFHCSSLGSILASVNIETNHCVSPEALKWLSAGLNSDVSSGRLKLASVLYCAGDMLRAESVLKETERLYHFAYVLPSCGCYQFAKQCRTWENSRACYILNEKAINCVCAFCVRFIPAEMNSIPCELRYELFRSTEEELLHRDVTDAWLDMAVVDSLPFLYFLQYKTYGNLQSYNNQQRALENLAVTVNIPEDFAHRETAFNLLGQCYEQEDRHNDALECYITSLNIRGTNNVARFHVCRLLAGMQNNQHKD